MTNHAFTIVRDEPFWLPRWIDHYVRQGFKHHELTVLNNGGPLSLPYPVRVIDVVNPVSFDHNWLRDTVQRYQHRLIEDHDAVVFAEVDEFLFWQHGTLKELCDQMKPGSSVRATCYSPLHLIEQEPNYPGSGPMLATRSTMYRTHGYDKVLVARRDLTWCRGFHVCYENQGPPDPSLLMVHMWMFDFELAWQRVSERQASGAKGFFGDGKSREQFHQHFVDRFRTWDTKLGSLMYDPVAIPQWIRSI